MFKGPLRRHGLRAVGLIEAAPAGAHRSVESVLVWGPSGQEVEARVQGRLLPRRLVGDHPPLGGTLARALRVPRSTHSIVEQVDTLIPSFSMVVCVLAFAPGPRQCLGFRVRPGCSWSCES